VLSLFYSYHSWAAVRVAFLRVYDQSGQPVRLERNGPGFFHVAVSYGDYWLHAHPRGGVQLSRDLSAFGIVDEVLHHPHLNEPSASIVNAVLGQPYDYFFTWGQEGGYYCSELVAILYGVAPTPMRFEGEYWRQYFAMIGQPPPQGVGVSPDKLYDALRILGFQSSNNERCSVRLLPIRNIL
jgi:hypothetical protein